MKVYLGQDAFRLAAKLIAFGGHEVAERICTYEVKRLAFKATPHNAPLLAFWAGVLARTRTVLADGEAIRLVCELEEKELSQFVRLERQSRRQVLPRPSPRVT